MRCDLHCPHPSSSSSSLGFLAGLAVFAGIALTIARVVGDPDLNAVADVVFQATVGVVAAGFAVWGGWLGGRTLYEHLRGPAERRKYLELTGQARPAAVTGRAPVALPVAPVKVTSRREQARQAVRS